MFSLVRVRQIPVFLESNSSIRTMRGSSGNRTNFRLIIWLLLIAFGAVFLVGALIRGRIRNRNVLSKGPTPFKPDISYNRPNLPGRDMVFSGPKMDPNLRVVHMNRPDIEQPAPQQQYVPEKPYVAPAPPAAPAPKPEVVYKPPERPKIPARKVEKVASRLVDTVIDRIIYGKTAEKKPAVPEKPKTTFVRYKPEHKPPVAHAHSHHEASGDGMPMSDGFFDDEDGRDTSKYEHGPRRPPTH